MTGSYFYNVKPKVELDETTRLQRGDDKMNTLLFDLLTNASPNGTEKIIADIITSYVSKNLPAKAYEVIPDDGGDNLIIRVGKANNVMFSSHMDTVHTSNRHNINLHITDENYVYGSIDEMSKLYYNDDDEHVTQHQIEQEAKKHGASYDHYIMWSGKLYGSDDDFDGWSDLNMEYTHKHEVVTKNSVLGADDKLGCYIMCRMIEKRVPGLYVFHVGEECGGIGSTHLSTSRKELFTNIDYCIAFDRKGYNDVIYRQSGGQCCSNIFAKTLCDEINKYLPPKEKAEPSPNGSFTDSANYIDLIAECTNMPVGYFDQHTSGEHFDLEWLERYAIPAYTSIKWSSLPVKRNPDEPRVNNYSSRFGSLNRHGYGGYNSGYGSYQDSFWDEEEFEQRHSGTKSTKRNKHQSALDKIRHLVENKVEKFEPDIGFESEETHGQRVQRVLYSFIASDLTLEEIAELVVDTYENAQASHFDW